ncbi:MAG: hypothetical protein E7678_02090 [Ruminococcaceae bacterium]|nr:hypothetical protein [Oscillospiraceae bacterium]
MITSLGFDTIAIHADKFYSNIPQTLKIFYEFGIKNFLFIFDYDPLCDFIPIIKAKMNEFKDFYKRNSTLRINIKCALNLHISHGAGFNNSIDKLYCNKKSNALLIAMPLFTDKNYDPIALDINNLLYKKSAFIILSSFEKIVESSNLEFCSKFINNPRIGISADLNYILNPEKEIFFNQVLNTNTLFLPSLSQDVGNYAGALSSADYAIKKYGKKKYYYLCSQINKASDKIFT